MPVRRLAKLLGAKSWETANEKYQEMAKKNLAT